MKKHDWTNKELGLLNSYNSLHNSYSLTPEELRSKSEIEEMLFIEAQLCISNKYIVGYQDRKRLGIFSFSEIKKLQKHYRCKGEVFTYHPVNFKTFLDHQAYIIRHKV